MSVHALKPWTELVKLHSDVESGSLAEAVFAIDLGAIATGDSTTPKVYRDPDAFFAATYITTDLHRLLEEVLSSLAGMGTFNRVLKLRSPFGGGKSHTLASLLHAARSRKSLNQIASCQGLPDPGKVGVAVFDGEKFTATGDKDVGNGQTVHTMWGWLAWQLGPKAYKVVQKHDTDRVSPAGDEIKDMLEAEGRPVLLLLDEVLKYMERAAAVGVKDSTRLWILHRHANARPGWQVSGRYFQGRVSPGDDRRRDRPGWRIPDGPGRDPGPRINTPRPW